VCVVVINREFHFSNPKYETPLTVHSRFQTKTLTLILLLLLGDNLLLTPDSHGKDTSVLSTLLLGRGGTLARSEVLIAVLLKLSETLRPVGGEIVPHI